MYVVDRHGLEMALIFHIFFGILHLKLWLNGYTINLVFLDACVSFILFFTLSFHSPIWRRISVIRTNFAQQAI